MRFDQIPAYGSSTELIANLSLATGTLRTAQLGDSTYVVLDAKQKAKFVSAEQQHRFNMPYQLTIPPTGDTPPLPKSDPENEENAQFFRPQPQSDREHEDSFADLTAVGFDTPNDAREDSHRLSHNDVVVAATDGLFDNVRVEEVEKLAERFMGAIDKISSVTKNVTGRPKADLFGGLAYSIAAQAVANYIQHDLRSPFAERAKLAGYNYEGGKPDDVTVMIAWVRENAKVNQAKAKL
ncbi:Protein phosphatase 2C 7 [Linderina pennispora]|nr:Protein phosphatase 2C 7 [Linderina pennispora]